MKKIMNGPDEVVDQMCEGMVLASPELIQLDAENRIIMRREVNTDKVNLISGGGSGHEPAHAGYVGEGMLDGAVCGDVFASPSVMQIYQAITSLRSSKGILLIVKNYSGDVMNFNGAAAIAQEDDGIQIETVFVDDDVAVTDSLYTVGRRGVAGTFFVHKIAGALAEEGADLKAVKHIAEEVIANVRTMGFALTSCTLPAKGEPTFEMAVSDMEFGVGIHGEPGVAREPVLEAQQLARKVTDRILSDLPYGRSDEVALLVNGLGGTPLQELFILNREVHRILMDKGISVYRTFVGNYMTSLDMTGASVTLLRLDEQQKRLLDAPAKTIALTIA
jgi:dihydroxyacetone kinase DhaK subunit